MSPLSRGHPYHPAGLLAKRLHDHFFFYLRCNLSLYYALIYRRNPATFLPRTTWGQPLLLLRIFFFCPFYFRFVPVLLGFYAQIGRGRQQTIGVGEGGKGLFLIPLGFRTLFFIFLCKGVLVEREGILRRKGEQKRTESDTGSPWLYGQRAHHVCYICITV